ncbi:hypothetical protein Glove_267g72 [Diversispora epigaea]|uniref:Replication factor C C-terminal domain-containing protein n=1 Tax=Diversispora epigaea TaxID=1348612 RepID=A0A397I6M3_9GLOM|nr:hypothetical protein Glove_267g72 [Diversispora epigaea]
MSKYSIHAGILEELKDKFIKAIEQGNWDQEKIASSTLALKKYPDHITSDIYTLLAQEPFIGKKLRFELKSNASDGRGINVVREEIKTYASVQLWKKYTRNVRFSTICNYIFKIIPAVQSRCTRFRFSPIKETEARSRIEYIIQFEKIASEDMRKSLNVLQACHAAYDYIDETVVYKLLEIRNLKILNISLIRCLKINLPQHILVNVQKLKREKGLALQDILTEIHKYLNDFEIPLYFICFIYNNFNFIDFRYNLSTGETEHTQSASMVGTFKTALDRSYADSFDEMCLFVASCVQEY